MKLVVRLSYIYKKQSFKEDCTQRVGMQIFNLQYNENYITI